MNIEKAAFKAILAVFMSSALVGSMNIKQCTGGSTKGLDKDTIIECKHYDMAYTIHMIDSIGEEEISEENIFQVFDILDMQHREIVYAQMVIESGHFKSRLSERNKNFFGMKHPEKRINVSKGKRNGYASYKNWAYSILDYKLWQYNYANNLNMEGYLKKISSIYAEDKEYLNKITKYI